MKKSITIVVLLTIAIMSMLLAGCSLPDNKNAVERVTEQTEADLQKLEGALAIGNIADKSVEAEPSGATKVTIPAPQTFVLIKLSEQRLWVVKSMEVTDNLDACEVLYETGIVSGTANTKNATPPGKYQINAKDEGTYLRPSSGGKVWVDYWMPFIDNSVGLHDATWRGEEEFGTDQYKSSGSHGCINMPHQAAADIFNLIEVGTPVYIVE